MGFEHAEPIQYVLLIDPDDIHVKIACRVLFFLSIDSVSIPDLSNDSYVVVCFHNHKLFHNSVKSL